MAPTEHLEWFEENIAWFEALAIEDQTRPVPSCPGWSIEDLINHLSFGLGLGYQVAVSKSPEIDDARGFEGVEWPDVYPVGAAAGEAFTTNMRSCLAVFLSTDPERPAWTYRGSGVAKFWFRRAAIETALHRLDAHEALGGARGSIPSARIADGIAEAIEFALPLAAAIAGEPEGGLAVRVAELALDLAVGGTPADATVSGDGEAVFAALWGRNVDQVHVDGDRTAAEAWLSRIDLAFADR